MGFELLRNALQREIERRTMGGGVQERGPPPLRVVYALEALRWRRGPQWAHDLRPLEVQQREAEEEAAAAAAAAANSKKAVSTAQAIALLQPAQARIERVIQPAPPTFAPVQSKPCFQAVPIKGGLNNSPLIHAAMLSISGKQQLQRQHQKPQPLKIMLPSTASITAAHNAQALPQMNKLLNEHAKLQQQQAAAALAASTGTSGDLQKSISRPSVISTCSLTSGLGSSSSVGGGSSSGGVFDSSSSSITSLLSTNSSSSVTSFTGAVSHPPPPQSIGVVSAVSSSSVTSPITQPLSMSLLPKRIFPKNIATLFGPEEETKV